MESLVVMAIAAVLFALAVPAFQQMLKGSRVTIAGRAVLDELVLARQTALSRNLPVEARFYMLPSELDPSGTPKDYRAFQTFIIDEKPVPLSKMIVFPAGVVVWEDAAGESYPRSSILLNPGPLAQPIPQDGKLGVQLPGYDYRYKFLSIRFKGNGETDMNNTPGGGAFLTLVSKMDVKSDGALPKNYVTIQIDPSSGRVRSFRP